MTAPLRKAISWLAAHVAPKRLHTIQVPTLIVIGEHDVPDCQAIAETLHRRIPNARKAVMARVGHMSNMEAPERFNALVSDFLAAQRRTA